jgi:hypothetical protein
VISLVLPVDEEAWAIGTLLQLHYRERCTVVEDTDAIHVIHLDSVNNNEEKTYEIHLGSVASRSAEILIEIGLVE